MNNTGIIAIGAIVLIYYAYTKGYFSFKQESYTQLNGTNFADIDKSPFIPSNLVNIFGKTEGYENSMADGGDSNVTERLMRDTLSDEAVSSHADYVNDMSMLATLGPNRTTMRDDYRPTVPFHGLPRTRPAETIPLTDARQTASEPDSHLHEYRFRKTTFKL